MDDLTVGDLIRHLQSYDPNHRLGLPGGLTFYRLKQRDRDLVMLEINEYEADLSPAFRRKHPEIKVAYVATELTDEPVQQVSVPRL